MQHGKPESATLRNRHRVHPHRRVHRVVDAIIISQPDFTVYFKLQNLVNFFVDRMNVITGTSVPSFEDLQHLKRCATHIDQLFEQNRSVFGNDLARMLGEFLSDTANFNNHLADTFYCESDISRNPVKLISLTVEASHLQWISVCILQEIKQALLH